MDTFDFRDRFHFLLVHGYQAVRVEHVPSLRDVVAGVIDDAAHDCFAVGRADAYRDAILIGCISLLGSRIDSNTSPAPETAGKDGQVRSLGAAFVVEPVAGEAVRPSPNRRSRRRSKSPLTRPRTTSGTGQAIFHVFTMGLGLSTIGAGPAVSPLKSAETLSFPGRLKSPPRLLS